MNEDGSNEIEELVKKLETWPFDVNVHDKLINALRINRTENAKELHGARQNKIHHFAFSTKEIGEWLEDLQFVKDVKDRTVLGLEFYKAIILDYPTSFYWSLYLEFVIESYAKYEDIIDQKFIAELVKEALNDTVHDFKNSRKVWGLVLSYFNNVFDSTGDEADFDTLLKLHLKRLCYPHETLRDSLSELSAVVSEYDPENYEQQMVAANKVFAKTLKSQRYYEVFEIKLNKNPNDPKVWIDYIEMVNKYSNGFGEVITLFHRSLVSCENRSVDDPSWLSVWLACIYIIYNEGSVLKQAALEPMLSKFIRSYPTSAISYAEYIRNCQIFEEGLGKFYGTREIILGLDLASSNSYDDWKVLALAILSYEFSLVNNGNIDLVSDLYKDAKTFVDIALNNNNDVFHSVEKLVVTVYEALDDSEQARVVIQQLLDRFKNQCEIWLYAYEFERRNRSSYEVISNLLEDGIENSKDLDWPERIFQEWLNFEQIHGNLDSFERALIKIDKILREISLNRLNIQNAAEEEIIERAKRSIGDDDMGDATRKRLKTNSSTEISRNREQFSIKISNLPRNITEDKLFKFFEDCGIPNDIKVYQEDENMPQAIIEWSGEQEVFSALTKNMKQIEGNEITIVRQLETTLWVCNFPPSSSHDHIKEMFEEIGKVVSIRFPSLKLNQSRRFCYVEYASHELAKKAVEVYGGKVLDDEITNKKYSLVVEISKPETRTNRSDVLLADREIYVQNLNFKKVNEKILEEAFKSFGTIDQIKIPLSDKMKSQGNVNNGYGFIIFKSDVAAKNALLLNESTLENRIIQVSPSKGKSTMKGNNKNPLALFNDLKTISIFNLNDTINQQQILAFLKNKFGSVNKVNVFSDIEAALVEFDLASDAGKASMLLNSETFEGKVLQVGLKSDLTRKLHGTNTAAKKLKLMVPPSLQRRRV